MSDTSAKLQLPAAEIIKQAFRYVFVERHNFISMAFLPVVALSLFGSILLNLNPEPIITLPKEGEMPTFNLAFIPLLLVNLVFYVMFAVAWHRKWILGESEITIYSALRWDFNKSKFLLRLIQIFLISFGILLGLGIFLTLLPGTSGFLVSSFGTILVLAISTLIFARLSLLLPASAVGDNLNIKDCVALTNGNGWRLGVLAIFPPIPLAFLQLILSIILIGALSKLQMENGLFGGLLLHLIEQVLNYIGIAVGVSALSMAYVAFTKEAEQQT